VNSTIISGNLATDIEKRTTQSGVSCANFRIAVQRRFKDQATGKREADFISVVAWRQQADFLAQYATKGDKLTVHGAIQVRSYDAKDGTKRFVTEIVADEVELDKRDRSGTGGNHAPAASGGGEQFQEVNDDDLPF
jgi:single-strand DNA-binding protein